MAGLVVRFRGFVADLAALLDARNGRWVHLFAALRVLLLVGVVCDAGTASIPHCRVKVIASRHRLHPFLGATEGSLLVPAEAGPGLAYDAEVDLADVNPEEFRIGGSTRGRLRLGHLEHAIAAFAADTALAAFGLGTCFALLPGHADGGAVVIVPHADAFKIRGVDDVVLVVFPAARPRLASGAGRVWDVRGDEEPPEGAAQALSRRLDVVEECSSRLQPSWHCGGEVW